MTTRLPSATAAMRTASALSLSIVLLLIGSIASATGKILVVGDSLSAAYGIDQRQGWVALLRDRLRAEGLAYDVVNASITGDTTRGGLSRLPAALERERPTHLVIALGGNDGLRGFAPAQMRDNLRRMIRMGRAEGAEVLLLGVRIPENYGKAFTEMFHRVYLELADEEQVRLVPFFLEGVAETRELMQPDGIHPSAAAQPRILDNVWGGLAPMLTPPATAAAGPRGQ